MTKRETLTESMRRYSNIVNEAEQLDELNPFKVAADAISFGKKGLRTVADKMKNKGRKKQVANSPVRQLENIEYTAKSFERALGDDPNQWVGKIDDYFREVHTETKQIVIDRSAAFDHGVGQEFGTDERVKLIMGRFNLEFKELVEDTARYARDPYSINPKTLYNKTKKRILEKIRTEIPTARSSPANHLKTVYRELMLDKESNLLPTRVKRYLAALMAFLAFVIYAEATDLEGKAKADREERLRNNPDIHYRYPDTPSADAPNPFDGGTNTTPRRWTGSRVYVPNTTD